MHLKILDFRNRQQKNYADGWALLKSGHALEAVEIAKKLAVAGDGHAYALLGAAYDYGGINLQQNKNLASVNYEQAIERCGSIVAFRGLAKLLYLGQGIPADPERSFMIYSRLAEEDSCSMAYLALARMYHLGKGVRQDLKEAEKWYRIAIRHGYFEAYAGLERLHAEQHQIFRHFVILVRTKIFRGMINLGLKKFIKSDWAY